MLSIFSSFFQLGGAKSFSEFLTDDELNRSIDPSKEPNAFKAQIYARAAAKKKAAKERQSKKKSLKKTVAQRKSRRSTPRRTARRSTPRRTARRTARRSARRTVRRSTRRTARRSTRRTARRSTPKRTARRSTPKRTSRRTQNRRVKVRQLTKRKLKGKPGNYECLTCKKGIKAHFTGKEPSPKGLGYCARCTPLKVTMKGTDGNLWENKKYTKGKRWVRV